MPRHAGKGIQVRNVPLLATVAISACAFMMLRSAVAQTSGVYLLQELKHDESPPLRDIPPVVPVQEGDIYPVPSMPLTFFPFGMSDPVAQIAGPLVSTVAGLNFSGQTSIAPPDANGAVGPTQYLQLVNYETLSIYKKSDNTRLLGPVQVASQVFHGFGGQCENSINSDAVVTYDKLADVNASGRWVILKPVVFSQPYAICVAVSQTIDATGSWNRYAFDASSGLPSAVPDFPKLAVWPDPVVANSAYYVGLNENPQTICALDRANMLAGTAARSAQCFAIDPGTFAYPADLDGLVPPPAGSPGYFMNATNPGNTLNLWKFYLNWNTPQPPVGPLSIAVPYYPSACSGGVLQKGGTVNDTLTAQTGLQNRLTYRKFPDHESFVVAHTIGSSTGACAATRWYELQYSCSNPPCDGVPAVYQRGTYTPADSDSRFYASASMDGLGDIAVGYSVSSSTTYPSIRYTGRVPTDPLGTLEGETSIVEGTAPQLGSHRWGDYTSMSVDPVFDCQFWYTNEYYTSTTTQTQIASFRFPSCIGCVGDCNRNHQVTIDEITLMQNIAMGYQLIDNCLRGDANGDGVITINEIIQAVNNANNGCPTGSMAPIGAGTSPESPTLSAPITEVIGSPSGARGMTVTIPIALRNGNGMVSAVQIDLLYPADVLSNPTCIKSGRLAAHSLWTSLPDSPPTSAGVTRLRAMLADLDAVSVVSDGPLFKCTFTVNEAAVPGIYRIAGEEQAVSDQIGNSLVSIVRNGSVTVY